MTNPDQPALDQKNQTPHNSALEKVRLFLANEAGNSANVAHNADMDRKNLDECAHHFNYCFSVLKATLESSPSSIIAFDLDGCITCMNTRFIEMWQLPNTALRQPDAGAVKEHIEKQAPEFVHFLQHLDAHFINPMTPHKQIVKCINGRTINVNASPQMMNGACIGIVMTCQDITNQLTIQQMQSLESAINTHEILSITDGHGLITHVNNFFCEISGYSRGELIGKNHKVINSGHHGREIWRGEVCNRSQSGKLYWVDSTVVPAMDSAGKPFQYISKRLQITQRKEAEQALIEAKLKAEEALSYNNVFLSNMSLEIRPPLDAIIGMTHIAIKEETNPTQLNCLEKIQFSGKHLLGIVDKILTFSILEVCTLETEEIEFNLNQVLANFDALISSKVAEKRLQLQTEVDPKLQTDLRGDPQRILEILVIYASNAIKFTDSGSITLRIRALQETPDSALVQFEVQDTGIGLSTEAVHNLFQAFHQADASISRKYGGTGLGLSICKQLVELMHGEIGVESQVGQGSTFWFQLPLSKCPEKTTTLPPPQRKQWDEHAFNNIHILVAEDSEFNQMVVLNLLEMVGAKVSIANNGQESLEILRQTRVDCVLMDVQMPVMDGLEATRLIRADATLSKTLIIALSANAHDEDRERCLQAGMNDFLSKPIEPAAMYSMLDKWLHQTATQEPIPQAIPHPSPTQHTANLSVVNLSTLSDMVKGNASIVKRFALQFLDAAQLGLSEIEAALHLNDIQTLKAVGHRIKASAITIGALEFGDLCAKLENIDSTVALTNATKILSDMQVQLEKINAEILLQLQAMPLNQIDAELKSLRILLVDGDSVKFNLVAAMLASLGVIHVVCEAEATHSLVTLQSQSFDVVLCKLPTNDMSHSEYVTQLAKCGFSGSVALLAAVNLDELNEVRKQIQSNNLHFLGVLDKPSNEAKLMQLLSRVPNLNVTSKK